MCPGLWRYHYVFLTLSAVMNSGLVDTYPDTSILFTVGMAMKTTSVMSFFEPYDTRI